MDGHPALLRRAAAAWEHMAGPAIISSTPPPALPKALTQQSGFHAVLSEPPSSSAISHWLLSLRLSSSWACLQEIPDLPKLAAEGDAWEERGSQLFLFSCLWLAQFGNGLHQPPVLPVGCHNSGLAHQGADQSAQKKVSVHVCVCKWSLGLQQGTSQQMWVWMLPWAHLLPAL